MAKYNEKTVSEIQPTVTLEGGKGFNQKPEYELIGILSTGLENTFYEKESERDKRFAEVLAEVAKKNKLFAAKALIYARTVFGQRTVTHRGAVELVKFLAGDEMGKKFFSKRSRKENKGGIVYRLDDMLEILACYLAKNGENAPIPNSIKKGFALAIEEADMYELAKYQAKNRNVSLVDIVNLVHPIESKKNGFVEITIEDYAKAIKGTKYMQDSFEATGEINGNHTIKISALRALVLGLLKQFNTVEDKNTEAGKQVSNAVKSGELTTEQAEEKLNELKTENFGELIVTKKIGYLALLRNLRNILKTNDTALLDAACDLLVEPNFIKKSLVWPHQIDLALEIMLLEFSGSPMQKVTKALDIAYEASIPNLEKLLPEGRTAVVFDTSASMEGGYGNGVQIMVGNKSTKINKAPAEKAALIAATFAKGVAGDVYHFGTHCAQIKGWNPNDSINTLKREFISHNGECGHGTDFGSCFKLFEKTNNKYDRVIIISDEQDGYSNVENSFKGYCTKFGTPYVYIINVCGYAPTAPIKSGNRVFRLFGYNQDLYDKIVKMEINPNVIIDEINKINI